MLRRIFMLNNLQDILRRGGGRFSARMELSGGNLKGEFCTIRWMKISRDKFSLRGRYIP